MEAKRCSCIMVKSKLWALTNELLSRYFAAFAVGLVYLAINHFLIDLSKSSRFGHYSGLIPIFGILMIYEVPAWMLLSRVFKSRWSGLKAEMVFAGIVAFFAVQFISASILWESFTMQTFILEAGDFWIWLKIIVTNMLFAILAAAAYSLIAKSK